MPSITFVCDREFVRLHFQDTIPYLQGSMQCRYFHFPTARTYSTPQDIESYNIDSTGCLVTCFGMKGFSSCCLSRAISGQCIILPGLHQANHPLIRCYRLPNFAMRRQKVFYDWHPNFFLFTAADFTLWMPYLSGFALHWVHLPWGFLSYQYFSSTLYELFSLLWPLHEV
jgi:hypothetical protein